MQMFPRHLPTAVLFLAIAGAGPALAERSWEQEVDDNLLQCDANGGQWDSAPDEIEDIQVCVFPDGWELVCDYDYTGCELDPPGGNLGAARPGTGAAGPGTGAAAPAAGGVMQFRIQR